jgi:transposase
MEITAIYKRVVGLDVHQNKISACAVSEQPDGTVTVTHREFGGFKRDRLALARWALEFAPDVVVMESTGIYWKSPYAALEKVGLFAWVVNARHVKSVPGRKTDVADAQWLATLARAGLVRASFIPPAEIRYLRLIARQRQKLGGMLASEKNRLHKLLADAGIRLNVVVSDIHGQAARAMVKALIAGKALPEILDCAGRLRATRAELCEAMQPEELSANHLFVLTEVMAHIEYLELAMTRFEQELLAGLSAWQPLLVLLQTIPGIDRIGAAMLLVEIGPDMQSFGSAERLASWVGICPGNNESASKRMSGRTRKGNSWVRRLLCEFAQAAARSRSALKEKFAAMSIRKGHKKSIVALGHKMLRIIFAMLSNQTPYQDKTVDYEALLVERNAPRWIKMLNKHGFLHAAV